MSLWEARDVDFEAFYVEKQKHTNLMMGLYAIFTMRPANLDMVQSLPFIFLRTIPIIRLRIRHRVPKARSGVVIGCPQGL